MLLALFVGLCLLCAASMSHAEEGLVAHWDFDEGQGDVLRDRSGNDNHGRLHGAEWVRCGQGWALRFDGVDDYVLCEDTPSLGITGPCTILAWVRPEALPPADAGIVGKHTETLGLTFYKDGSCYWYVSSGGNHINAPVKLDEWQHVAGVFDGTRMSLYVNGFPKASKESQYKEVKRGKNMQMGCFSPNPAQVSPATKSLAHFTGMIDQVRVYSRALTTFEIQTHYKKEAGDHGLDTSGFDKMAVTAYPYFEQGLVVVDVDCRGFLGLPPGTWLNAEISSAKGEAPPIAAHKVEKIPDSGLVREVALKGAFEPGEHWIRVLMADAEGVRAAETVALRYSKAEPEVSAPATRTVMPLPPPVVSPRYEVKLGQGGGFQVLFGRAAYDVESSYSYPNGGENRLTVAAFDQGEKEWKVQTVPTGEAGVHRVFAEGRYYSVVRKIILQPSRVLVNDTITNKTNDVLGILLSNHCRAKDAKARRMGSPTVFLHEKERGIGLVALDDVYQVQQKSFFDQGRAGLRSDHFGLDAGASHTLEWAVYPTASADYYDFINQVRKDEGLCRRIEGAFCFIGRDDPPSEERVRLWNLRYVSVGCLGKPLDDPELSLEGIEFTEYPKECAALKRTFAETYRRFPGMKTMFHIAHGLYATNRPEQLFPDSRVIKADGRQQDYGGQNLDYYRKYFSERRVQEGYRWHIFYPTLDNSFGKAMLKATDHMLDEIGVTGVWADGFFCGYAGAGWLTYDRWDGHTVLIDPNTKTVTRKVGHVTLLALPVLKAVAEKIAARGGVVITNDFWGGPRSLWLPNFINCCESGGGEATIGALHLGPSVTCLGHNLDPSNPERGTYEDILRKLDWGGLYFFYGSAALNHDSVIQQMFPITVTAIRSGIIRGEDRIVTRHSGIYGWHGDRDLHFVHRYDGRGWPAPHALLTTVDSAGVRTEVHLGPSESAVVKKVPLRLEAEGPVNLIVRQLDAKGVRVLLNGKGPTALRVGSGDFVVKPGRAYQVTTDRTQAVTASADGVLTVSLALDGPAAVQIESR